MAAVSRAAAAPLLAARGALLLLLLSAVSCGVAPSSAAAAAGGGAARDFYAETYESLHDDHQCFDASCGVYSELASPESLFVQSLNKTAPHLCTVEDVGYFYTDCSATTSKRTLFFFWKPPAICVPSPSFDLPPSVEGISCDVSCEAGQYLDVSTSQCKNCPVGHFSYPRTLKWGGEDGMPWLKWPAQISSYCVSAMYDPSAWVSKKSEESTCSTWQVTQEGTVDSGDNVVNHYLESALVLNARILVEGHVRFEYKVSAEPSADYLMFRVDDVIFLKVSQTEDAHSHTGPSRDTSWAVFGIDISPGYHRFEWIYYKDRSVSYGRDRAEIKSITLLGSLHNPPFCRECPAGTFANVPGSSKCLPCDNKEVSTEKGASSCSKCNATEFTYVGSSKCYDRPFCADEDMGVLAGPCVDGVQQMQEFWLAPRVCDEEDEDHTPINFTRACTPSTTCPSGQYHKHQSEEESDCAYCDAGLYYDTSKGECRDVLAGSAVGPKYEYYSSFEPSVGWKGLRALSTECHGECFSGGWRLGGTFTDSGGGNGVSDSVLHLDVDMLYAGSVSINISVSCDSQTGSQFLVMRNAAYDPHGRRWMTVPQAQSQESREAVPVDSIDCGRCNSRFVVRQYNLTLGVNRLSFRYKRVSPPVTVESLNGDCDHAVIKSIVIIGGASGGSTVSHTCPENYYTSTDRMSQCHSCAEGTSSAFLGSTHCEPCIAGYYSDAGKPCRPCGQKAVSGPAAAKCLYDCSAIEFTTSTSDGETTEEYNLSPLSGDIQGPIPSASNQNVTYLINMCNMDMSGTLCKAKDGSPIKTQLCMVTGTGTEYQQAFSIGGSMSFDRMSVSEKAPFGGLDVSYTRDNIKIGPLGYTCSEIYSTIHMICDATIDKSDVVVTMEPALTSNSVSICRFKFEWKSKYGCRECTLEDIVRTAGECKEGIRKIVYSWKTPGSCYEKSVLLPTAEFEMCGDMFMVEMEYVLFGVLAMLLVFSVVLNFLLFRERKKLKTKLKATAEDLATAEREKGPAVDLDALRLAQSQASASNAATSIRSTPASGMFERGIARPIAISPPSSSAKPRGPSSSSASSSSSSSSAAPAMVELHTISTSGFLVETRNNPALSSFPFPPSPAPPARAHAHQRQDSASQEENEQILHRYFGRSDDDPSSG